MSNERKLLVYRDAKLVLEFALSGDSVTIGRGDACDVVLESESVSRMHAKVIIQEEALYLENQSSTGQLFVDSNQVEMAEWPENSEAKIGPFVLRWAFGEAKKSAAPRAAAAAPAPAPSEAAPSSEANAAPPAEASSNFGFGGEWASPPAEENPEALSLVNNEEENVNFAVAEVVDDDESGDDDEGDDPDVDHSSDDAASPSGGEASYVDQDGSTRISSNDAIGVLKVTQGETIGREIKLDQGFQWIVGRSSKCHVKIDNNKLSRQHFKIVKVAGRYRVQDLGSANGTRLNGIAVTDAPLSPFDTIVAGPVEFQFLIAQPHLENAPALAGAAAQPFSSQETTQFAPPPMVYSGDGANPFEHAMHAAAAASDHAASGGATNASAGIFANAGKASAEPKSLTGKAALWWNAQPKNKRLLYVGTVAILLAVLLMPGEEAPTTAPTAPVAATTGETPTTNAAAALAPEAAPEQRSENISPEFYLLNPEERRKIEDAYARAQRARNAGNWKEAVEQSKEVLKYVDRYKDIADILAESQTHFNDIILGAVTKDLKNSLDAEAQTTEQVNLLIEAGKKAIAETRWTDAQEQCAKAVSLDPRNEEANKCFAAAYGQNANFIAEKPPVEVAVPTDPDLERQAELERDLEGKKQIYQMAQALEQEGKLDRALDSYKTLHAQVAREIDNINVPGRFPAAISGSYSEKNTELKTLVEQRMKDIYFQYETEYRTQLVDAEQLIANQDYIRARETYDRILNAAPNFSDVRNKRAELYRRMISEARGIYHEALIYESVGDLQAAIDKYSQTKRLLGGIVHPSADEYFRKANAKLKDLVP